ncbi:alpha/beta fold hydrolase [Epibacterium sp. SM1979]|uniref:Alpha/beta fold hydrolase n=1 Tax=Tritonibacter litoralis TaxID=2662264 RepID=A0A843YNU3_9RHOB|nr:alpha/beta fold hydrolase [Tritonibacter litoralis]MQQ10287.1 alpha/beta fold hydrolase [Tritonibacter litoralis]
MPDFDPDQSLYPFTSRWVTLGDGTRMHYVDEGTGPVLLLLHGNPAWSFLYRNIILGLRGHFRCIAPDLPGFGLSQARAGFGYTAKEQADVIVDFVDQLGLKGIGVMMQDWGGPIGLHLTQTRPQSVERLIIGNTFGWPLKRRGPRVFSSIMGGMAGRMGAKHFNGVLLWFFRMGVTKPLRKEVWDMYQAPFKQRKKRAPTHIFPKQLTEADEFLQRVEEGLSAISNRPALILWGDKDFAFNGDERGRFETAFPYHLSITLKGAGHFIQEDAPDAINKAVLDWYGYSE